MTDRRTAEGTDFGARLKRQRESRSLSVLDISKITKIPEKNIVFLESGQFDELPGDVFVRGFIKSYARAVGLDVDATLNQYADAAGKGPRPRAEPSLAKPPRAARSESHEVVAVALPRRPTPAAIPAVAHPEPEAPPVPEAPVLSPEEIAAAAAAAERRRVEEEERELFSSLQTLARGKGYGLKLALAVLLLVIVAALGLSLLLRLPERDERVGGGTGAHVGQVG